MSESLQIVTTMGEQLHISSYTSRIEVLINHLVRQLTELMQLSACCDKN